MGNERGRIIRLGNNCTVITPKGDEATCNMLHRMLRSGLNPILLLIKARKSGLVRERARRLGFSGTRHPW